MRFTVSPDIASVVRPGILWMEGAIVVDREPRLDAPLAAAESAVRVAPPEEFGAVRAMYRRVGIDPTKTRPSSEALLQSLQLRTARTQLLVRHRRQSRGNGVALVVEVPRFG